MKRVSLILCGLCFQLSAADVGIGWNASQLSQPVELDTTDETLTAINHGLQLTISEGNWLTGLALAHGSDSKDWQERRRDTNAAIDFVSHEVFFNYYWGNTTFKTALGASRLDYQYQHVIHKEVLNVNILNRLNKQWYDNEDTFFELGVNYLFELPAKWHDFSVDIGFSATNYDTKGQQGLKTENVQVVDNSRVEDYIQANNIKLGLIDEQQFTINESLWLYNLAFNLDYSFTVLEQSALVSLWFENELSSQQGGSVVATRLRNNNRVIRREFPLSEVGEQSEVQNLQSFGADLNLAISDSLSMSLSVFDSDQSEPQWQIGAFYWF